jgi:hypothetical protein
MIIARPIQYTSNPDAYRELFRALGLRSLGAEGDWEVFTAGSGRVALHTVPAGDALDGDVDLGFESDDLYGLGWEVVAEGGIEAVVVPAELPIVVLDETPGDDVDGPLSALALWTTSHVADAAGTLEKLGLRPLVRSDAGGWVQLRADSGLAAVHAGETSRAELSFEYAGDVAGLVEPLRPFGARIVDETYGRTLLVDRPGGGEPIWINERQTDLYGYSVVRDRPSA